MSSLIEASGNEGNSIVAVNSISGNILTTNAIPKRRWSGSSFTNLSTGANEDSLSMPSANISSDADARMPQSNEESHAQTTSESQHTSSSFTWQEPSAAGLSELSMLNNAITEQREEPEGSTSSPSAGRGTNGQDAETNKQLDDLITAMKTHTVSDDPSRSANGDAYPQHSSFDFDFAPKTSTPTKIPFNASADQTSQPFKFSFAAPLPNMETLDLSSYHAPHTTGHLRPRAINTATLSTSTTPNPSDNTKVTISSHPLSQASHSGIHQEEKKQDGMPLLTADGYVPDSFDYLSHRKILPLPKPRWKRKLSKLQNGQHRTSSTDNGTQATENGKYGTEWVLPTGAPPLAPYVWQFTPPAQELQRTYTLPTEETAWKQVPQGQQQQFSDFGSDSGSVDRAEGFVSGDASYRDNAKKMKRSTNGQSNEFVPSPEGEDKKPSRRKELTKDKVDDTSTEGTGASPFPQTTFNFTVSDNTRRLKQLPKYDELPPALPYLALYKTAGVAPSNEMQSQNRATVNMSHAGKLQNNHAEVIPSTVGKGTPNNADVIPNTTKTSSNGKHTRPPAAKKAGKSGTSESSKPDTSTDTNRNTVTEKPPAPAATVSKKGKSGHRRKKQEDQVGGLSLSLPSSDVSLVQCPHPDEWICLFCQFEIFVRDLDSARHNGGYYKRIRERRRRLREAEARRNAETYSGAASDCEDDEPSLQIGDVTTAANGVIANH